MDWRCDSDSPGYIQPHGWTLCVSSELLRGCLICGQFLSVSPTLNYNALPSVSLILTKFYTLIRLFIVCFIGLRFVTYEKQNKTSLRSKSSLFYYTRPYLCFPIRTWSPEIWLKFVGNIFQFCVRVHFFWTVMFS